MFFSLLPKKRSRNQTTSNTAKMHTPAYTLYSVFCICIISDPYSAGDQTVRGAKRTHTVYATNTSLYTAIARIATVHRNSQSTDTRHQTHDTPHRLQLHAQPHTVTPHVRTPDSQVSGLSFCLDERCECAVHCSEVPSTSFRPSALRRAGVMLAALRASPRFTPPSIHDSSIHSPNRHDSLLHEPSNLPRQLRRWDKEVARPAHAHELRPERERGSFLEFYDKI